jgi:hypothetical protein
MSSERITTRKQLEELLIRKASEDQAFREQLLANPKAVLLKEFGIQVQGNLKITVLEESANNLFLVLPVRRAAAGTGELAEHELEAVAGGIVGAGANKAADPQSGLPANTIIDRVSTSGL